MVQNSSTTAQQCRTAQYTANFTTPPYLTPPETIPHYTTPRHATPHHTTPRHTTPHHTTPHHTTPHHITPQHTTPHPLGLIFSKNEEIAKKTNAENRALWKTSRRVRSKPATFPCVRKCPPSFGENGVGKSSQRGVLGCLRRISLGWISCSYISHIKPNPTHENICSRKTTKNYFAVAKVTFKWPKCHFNLIFLGLGWPRVGEFVGFIIIFVCFPTQHNLVNYKHRSIYHTCTKI